MSKNITLKDVILSFPHLASPDNYDKFSCSLLLDSDDPQKAVIEAAMVEVMAEVSKKFTVPNDKKCFRDGNDKPYDGYAGRWYLSCSRKDRFDTADLVDRQLQPLDADDKAWYPGCKVDALVNIWIQNNQHGKRVNCEILKLRWRGDGERMGGGRPQIDTADVFDALPDLEMEDSPI